MRVFTTTERIFAAVGFGAFGVGCFVVGFFNPSNAGFFPGCPLLDVTGFACPGCGLTRGFHALFHGEFLTALDYNALIPFFAIGFVYLLLLLASIAMRGKAFRLTVVTPASLWVFLVLALGFGLLRNIPVYPLEILFP
jgi:hypothetical protein